jgi:hypothetical protein
VSLHPNSAAAYREWADEHGDTRAAAVIRVYLQRGPQTDRQVCYALNSRDLNYCRPSITHLKQSGVLREISDTVCEHTHKEVRVCYLIDNPTGAHFAALSRAKPRAPKVRRLGADGYPLMPPPPCEAAMVAGRCCILGADGAVYFEVSPDRYDPCGVPEWRSAASQKEALQRARVLARLLSDLNHALESRPE